MERLRGWSVPAIPFFLSLVLSASTVGTHIYWQDSGFYLTAVRDLGVLYPHGFVVYQLLCKAWTGLLFFVDFVLAVHLFSALCAALAAGTVALAARDFLVEKGEIAAVLTGCLLASAYTFWFSGIYAKVYALLYFVLALLLRSLVRSLNAPSRGGVLQVGFLAGLGWAVHPSVALGGLALLAYFVWSGKHLGWKPVAAAIFLGLAVALGPGLLLPALSSRDVETSMGLPRTAKEVLAYLLGSRFTQIPGAFGPDRNRIAAAAVFVWEEYLGVGLLLIALGVRVLLKSRPRLLAAGLLWVLPFGLIATLFKLEAQSDHWGVAACLPLFLVLAVGLQSLGTMLGRPRVWQCAVGGAGLVWAIVANRGDLNLRTYDLAETFGTLYLRNLEPDAVLFAHVDDVIGITRALQSVRGIRRDVVVVNASQLGGEDLWYDRCLQRHHPDLRLPTAIPEFRGRNVRDSDPIVSAFLSANLDGRRPLYVTTPLASELVPAGHVLVPQGVLWRLLPASEDRVRPEHWSFPLEPEDLPSRFRRKRGLSVTSGPDGYVCEEEPYERRLQRALLKGRILLADWQFRHGEPALALRLYESVLALDPAAGRNEAQIHSMALCYLALGRPERAEIFFRRVLDLSSRPWTRASSWLALGDLARGRGNQAGARDCYREAARIQGLSPEQKAQVQGRLEGP